MLGPEIDYFISQIGLEVTLWTALQTANPKCTALKSLYTTLCHSMMSEGEYFVLAASQLMSSFVRIFFDFLSVLFLYLFDMAPLYQVTSQKWSMLQRALESSVFGGRLWLKKVTFLAKNVRFLPKTSVIFTSCSWTACYEMSFFEYKVRN